MGKIRYYDMPELDEGWYELKKLSKGEFIKRSKGAVKVYRKGEYDREMKAYVVHDQDDISRSMYVKGKTRVWVGFTY